MYSSALFFLALAVELAVGYQPLLREFRQWNQRTRLITNSTKLHSCNKIDDAFRDPSACAFTCSTTLHVHAPNNPIVQIW